MSEEKKPVDGGGPARPKTDAQLRREREAAALRANLQRRKQQARERRDGPGRDRADDDSTGA